MFSSKYGKCQSGSISATPSAEMNSVEMIFAIAVTPSAQGVSAGSPAQNPKLTGRRKIRPAAEPELRARRDAPAKTAPGHPPAPDPGRRAAVAYRPVAAGTQTRPGRSRRAPESRGPGAPPPKPPREPAARPSPPP